MNKKTWCLCAFVAKISSSPGEAAGIMTNCPIKKEWGQARIKKNFSANSAYSAVNNNLLKTWGQAESVD